MRSLTQQLEATLHEEIPLTLAMGLHVANYQNGTLILTAPLAPNINHKQTAFGGSLYSVAVLTGWGLLHLQLKQHRLEGHIVIATSHMQYEKPVASDITAQCKMPPAPTWDQFLKTYERRGRARITLEIGINDGAARLEGTYVVHK